MVLRHGLVEPATDDVVRALAAGEDLEHRRGVGVLIAHRDVVALAGELDDPEAAVLLALHLVLARAPGALVALERVEDGAAGEALLAGGATRALGLRGLRGLLRLLGLLGLDDRLGLLLDLLLVAGLFGGEDGGHEIGLLDAGGLDARQLGDTAQGVRVGRLAQGHGVQLVLAGLLLLDLLGLGLGGLGLLVLGVLVLVLGLGGPLGGHGLDEVVVVPRQVRRVVVVALHAVDGLDDIGDDVQRVVVGVRDGHHAVAPGPLGRGDALGQVSGTALEGQNERHGVIADVGGEVGEGHVGHGESSGRELGLGCEGMASLATHS
ncbi:MAG: hypothetical protein CMB99_01275 [Flavobacteriaceae bacterium]|nr:hypothetical protein [Flavobacteriaceae bacterium]